MLSSHGCPSLAVMQLFPSCHAEMSSHHGDLMLKICPVPAYVACLTSPTGHTHCLHSQSFILVSPSPGNTSRRHGFQEELNCQCGYFQSKSGWSFKAQLLYLLGKSRAVGRGSTIFYGSKEGWKEIWERIIPSLVWEGRGRILHLIVSYCLWAGQLQIFHQTVTSNVHWIPNFPSAYEAYL